MKNRTGKYMFLGNVNSMFGPGIRYADSIKDLKLKAWEKDEIRKGEGAMFCVREGKIVRINSNGSRW
jgi:hypothetical protein